MAIKRVTVEGISKVTVPLVGLCSLSHTQGLGTEKGHNRAHTIGSTGERTERMLKGNRPTDGAQKFILHPPMGLCYTTEFAPEFAPEPHQRLTAPHVMHQYVTTDSTSVPIRAGGRWGEPGGS